MPLLLPHIISVSYTHLDVYKRQQLHYIIADVKRLCDSAACKHPADYLSVLSPCPYIASKTDMLCNIFSKFIYFGIGFGAVSYTHLDVYKRQPMHITALRGRSWRMRASSSSITLTQTMKKRLSLIHIFCTSLKPQGFRLQKWDDLLSGEMCRYM